MRSTRIVTSFIKFNNQILILKRSEKVRSMKGLWSGVSGIIENNENPIDRTKIESPLVLAKLEPQQNLLPMHI